jgi:hypothetical protein
MRGLGILHVGLHHADVVGDVTVDGEKIGQAVQIVVKKKAPKVSDLVEMRAIPVTGAWSVNRPDPSLW